MARPSLHPRVLAAAGLLLALAGAAPTVAAELAGPAAGVVREYCDLPESAPLAAEVGVSCWDDDAPESMAQLEEDARDEGAERFSPTRAVRYYEGRSRRAASWVFNGTDRATRYKPLYRRSHWIGIGVTTFCSAPAEACQAYLAQSAAAMPTLLVAKLGPQPEARTGRHAGGSLPETPSKAVQAAREAEAARTSESERKARAEARKQAKLAPRPQPTYGRELGGYLPDTHAPSKR